MVVISEHSGMFWGVTLDGGKRYNQTIESSFHISMAALDTHPDTVSKEPVSVMIQHEKAEFLLCTLKSGKLYQQPLDLNFTEGEEVTFFLNGKGVVHLTGYLVPEDEPQDMSIEQEDDTEESSEEEEECSASDEEGDEEEVPKLKPILFNDDDDSEDDDEDEDYSPVKKSAKKKAKYEDESDDVDLDEDEDDNDDDDSDNSDGEGVYEYEFATAKDDECDEEPDTSGSFIQYSKKGKKLKDALNGSPCGTPALSASQKKRLKRKRNKDAAEGPCFVKRSRPVFSRPIIKPCISPFPRPRIPRSCSRPYIPCARPLPLRGCPKKKAPKRCSKRKIRKLVCPTPRPKRRRGGGPMIISKAVERSIFTPRTTTVKKSNFAKNVESRLNPVAPQPPPTPSCCKKKRRRRRSCSKKIVPKCKKKLAKSKRWTKPKSSRGAASNYYQNVKNTVLSTLLPSLFPKGGEDSVLYKYLPQTFAKEVKKLKPKSTPSKCPVKKAKSKCPQSSPMRLRSAKRTCSSDSVIFTQCRRSGKPKCNKSFVVTDCPPPFKHAKRIGSFILPQPKYRKSIRPPGCRKRYKKLKCPPTFSKGFKKLLRHGPYPGPCGPKKPPCAKKRIKRLKACKKRRPATNKCRPRKSISLIEQALSSACLPKGCPSKRFPRKSISLIEQALSNACLPKGCPSKRIPKKSLKLIKHVLSKACLPERCPSKRRCPPKRCRSKRKCRSKRRCPPKRCPSRKYPPKSLSLIKHGFPYLPKMCPSKRSCPPKRCPSRKYPPKSLSLIQHGFPYLPKMCPSKRSCPPKRCHSRKYPPKSLSLIKRGLPCLPKMCPSKRRCRSKRRCPPKRCFPKPKRWCPPARKKKCRAPAKRKKTCRRSKRLQKKLSKVVLWCKM